MVSCIFIIEMPPGGQHKKIYTFFCIFFSKIILYSQWLYN